MSVLNNLLYYTSGNKADNLVSPSSVKANSALSLHERKFALIIHHTHADILTNTDTVMNKLKTSYSVILWADIVWILLSI